MHKAVKDVLPFFYGSRGVMYTFLDRMVEPIFTDSIPTAAVCFDKEKTKDVINFLINEEFWNKCNFNEKVFIFIHETLHVMFNHGKRGTDFLKSLPENQRNFKILNIAEDICINELILKEYMSSIPRSAIPLIENCCLIESVFKEPENILYGQTFEYYYNKILEENPEIEMDTIDIHISDLEPDENDSEEVKAAKEAIKEAIEEIKEEHFGEGDLTEGNFSQKNKTQSYSIGDSATGEKITTKADKVSKEQSLENYINVALASSQRKGILKRKTKWYGVNRRTAFAFRNTNLILPVVKERKIVKHNVVCYADLSGSCEGVSKKFLDLIADLDQNKYDVTAHVFADRVKDVNMKGSKLTYGDPGGGTNIREVLNHFNNNYSKQMIDAVFVLTDGFYNDITHLSDDIYKKWYFFMLYDNGYGKNNIPRKSTSYNVIE